MARQFASASQIERILECPASAALPQTYGTSYAAKNGTDKHEELSNCIDGKPSIYSLESLQLPEQAQAEIAFSWDAVSDEARELGRIPHRQYPDSPFSTLFGTVDVVGNSVLRFANFEGNEEEHACVDVIDWKHTAEIPSSASWQLKTLAMMAAKARGVKYARTRIGHFSKTGGDAPTFTPWCIHTPDELASYATRLKGVYKHVASLVQRKDPVSLHEVRYGPHCHFCPAYASCPYTKSLLSGPRPEIEAVTQENAREAYLVWQSLRTASQRLEERIKGFAVVAPIELGDDMLYGKRMSDGKFAKFRKWDGQ